MSKLLLAKVVVAGAAIAGAGTAVTLGVTGMGTASTAASLANHQSPLAAKAGAGAGLSAVRTPAALRNPPGTGTPNGGNPVNTSTAQHPSPSALRAVLSDRSQQPLGEVDVAPAHDGATTQVQARLTQATGSGYQVQIRSQTTCSWPGPGTTNQPPPILSVMLSTDGHGQAQTNDPALTVNQLATSPSSATLLDQGGNQLGCGTLHPAGQPDPTATQPPTDQRTSPTGPDTSGAPSTVPSTPASDTPSSPPAQPTHL